MNKNIILSFYEEYTRDHRIRYVADIMHIKYGEHKIIKDYDRFIVKQKADKIIEKWEQIENKEKNAEFAHNKTIEIQQLNNKVENILIDGMVGCIDVFKLYEQDLETELSDLKDAIRNLKYSIGKLEKPVLPKENMVYEYPNAPLQKDFVPKYSLIHKILPFLKSKVDAKKKEEFEKAYQDYLLKFNNIELLNEIEKKRFERETKEYADKLPKYQQELESQTIRLRDAEEKHIQKKQDIKQQIEKIKETIIKGEKEIVEDYSFRLLENSLYPIEFDKNILISYNSDLLAIDYSLPSIDTFPNLSEMKFIKGQCLEIPMTEKVFTKHYDNTLYRIALRTINEIFSDNYLRAVNSVAFNGWVTALNKSNGKTETNCIMSIKTNRDQILDIDFLNIEPKSCFKALKGIASSQLSTITAIKPIVSLNMKDKRFVEHYSVVDDLENTTNLASMYWEDFEHLIRELFEKEFSPNGGEVKVTRASRDGGVDAIVFDPDPIRGGKIVIQAKRYTNTVGVSAVRDLYGTVLNEGATKGILVTTSDYGGDSYEFAKDKPLTLMNGSNLLYLLEKHGQHARIDINEAKKQMSQI